MSFLSYLVIIFGYIALAVFVLGMAYRIWNWGRLPTGFSWGLFPKPTRWTASSFLFGKILAIPTLLKSTKEVLIIALIMHFAILASVALHPELFFPYGTENIQDIIGSCAGIAGVAGVAYFVFRHFGIKETRDISAFSDYFWIFFLLIQVGLGAGLRVGNVVDPEVYREFATSVVTLNPILPPQNPWFLIHIFLGEIYLMYIVSGKMMHVIGWIFAQYILVRK